MTAQAIVKKADLDRMAVIANERNVTVEVIEGGRTIRVSPALPSKEDQVSLAPRGGVRF